MKEWTKPAIQELEFCNTEWDVTSGQVPDSYIVDAQTGEYIGPYKYSL